MRAGGMDHYKKEVFNGQINKSYCKVMGEHKDMEVGEFPYFGDASVQRG